MKRLRLCETDWELWCFCETLATSGGSQGNLGLWMDGAPAATRSCYFSAPKSKDAFKDNIQPWQSKLPYHYSPHLIGR